MNDKWAKINIGGKGIRILYKKKGEYGMSRVKKSDFERKRRAKIIRWGIDPV